MNFIELWLLIGFITSFGFALKYTRTFDLEQILGVVMYSCLGPITTILLLVDYKSK